MHFTELVQASTFVLYVQLSLVKAFSTKLGLAFPTQSQIFEVGQVCG